MHPELEVEVHELRDLKHNGGHQVQVEFLGRTCRSQFIDGYGSFKPIHFFASFPLTESQAISSDFWNSNSIYITIIHQRTFTDDKIVGDCVVGLRDFRQNRKSSSQGVWVNLRYKGENRGAIKIRISGNKDVPTPAISATVSPVPRPSQPVGVSSDWPS